MGRGLAMDRAQQWFVGAALPAALVGLTVVPWLLARGDLPSPIAIHFDTGGDADGSAPLSVHLAVVAAFTLPAAAVLLWAGWRRSSEIGILAALAAFLGWLVGAVNAVLLLANEGHDHWREVSLGAGAVWGPSFSALGVAVPVALLVRQPPVPPVDDEGQVYPVGASERAAWFGSTSGLLVGTAVLFLTFASTVVLLAAGTGAFATALVVFAVTAVLTVGLQRVRVKVGERGVVVAGGAAGWPRLRFALDEIEGARAVEIDPKRPYPDAGGGASSWLMLGWGYRGSLRLMGRAAWVLRKGPALQLDLAGGRRFWVAVDGADEAAAVLNGLLARARANPSG